MRLSVGPCPINHQYQYREECEFRPIQPLGNNHFLCLGMRGSIGCLKFELRLTHAIKQRS